MVKFTDEMKVSGFEMIPEGTHVLKVVEIKVERQQGKVKGYVATLADSKGRRITNRYNTSDSNKYKLQAMRSFYTLLTKGCELSEDVDGEIDEQLAVGRYVVAKVKHSPGAEGRVWQNLGYIEGSASGFDDMPFEEHVAIEEDDDPYA